MKDVIALSVEVPVASFRESRAKDYIASYPVPPPSSVYGMLLSMVGEVNRHRHCGVRLAMAFHSIPDKSVVLRKIRRFKQEDLNSPENSRPDYQEILTEIEMLVWIDASQDKSEPNLSQRIQQGIEDPSSIDRFGSLCLGESSHLVDSIDLLPNKYEGGKLQWLVRDRFGWLTLPYWVDHVGSAGTRWERYKILESDQKEPREDGWTRIQGE
jgi:CRISPR-associated protein Cas5t